MADELTPAPLKPRERRRDRTWRYARRAQLAHLRQVHPDGAVDCICEKKGAIFREAQEPWAQPPRLHVPSQVPRDPRARVRQALRPAVRHVPEAVAMGDELMPGNAFALTAPPASGDIYVTALSFVRATRSQDSAGGMTLTFDTVLPNDVFTGELIPQRSRYIRTVHGTIEQVSWEFYLVCNADLRVGDRTSSISSFLVEVAGIRHFGTEYTQVDLSYVR